MRSKAFSSGLGVGGIVVSAALALSVVTPAHASTSIFGTPKTTATAQRWWAFQPWATDTDHRAVSYTIKNKPWWASFNSRYGHLYGVPPAAAIGTYSNIVISATDGISSASLPPFSLTVHPLTSTGGTGGTPPPPPPPPPTTGSATVNWTPPTHNTDGTALTNLAGYTINYGTNSSQLTSSVKVTNPGLTSYVIENLAAGTYYFDVRAYNNTGQTSSASELVTATVK
jgi:hypothetical protein